MKRKSDEEYTRFRIALIPIEVVLEDKGLSFTYEELLDIYESLNGYTLNRKIDRFYTNKKAKRNLRRKIGKICQTML